LRRTAYVVAVCRGPGAVAVRGDRRPGVRHVALVWVGARVTRGLARTGADEERAECGEHEAAQRAGRRHATPPAGRPNRPASTIRSCSAVLVGTMRWEAKAG